MASTKFTRESTSHRRGKVWSRAWPTSLASPMAAKAWVWASSGSQPASTRASAWSARWSWSSWATACFSSAVAWRRQEQTAWV